MAIQFYPQANPNANSFGDGIALPSAAAVQNTPSNVLPQFQGLQSSVMPSGGDFSIQNGLALGNALGEPFKAAGEALSNIIDPVKRAQRKVALLTAQDQVGQLGSEISQQPLKSAISNTGLHNAGLAMGLAPNTLESIEPSIVNGTTPAPKVPFPDSSSTPSTAGSANSPSTALPNAVGASLYNASSSSPVSPLPATPQASGLDAKGYPVGLPAARGGLQGSDALMASLLNKSPEPANITQMDPMTGQMKLVPNPRYGRQLTELDNAEKQLRADAKQKGMTTADYAPTSDILGFTQSHPGTFDADIDKQVKAYPKLVDAENQLSSALDNPNLPDRDISQIGNSLATHTPFIGQGEQQAVQDYNTAKSQVVAALALVANPKGGYNRGDAALANSMAGGAPVWPWQGSGGKAAIKQRIGEQLGGLRDTFQDYQQMGKYVNPVAANQLSTASTNLASSMAGIGNGQNSENVFSDTRHNVTQPMNSTPSAPRSASTITDSDKAVYQKFMAKETAKDPNFANTPTGKRIAAILSQ